MPLKSSLAVQSIEDKLGCGFWRRDVGADEMQWSRGLYRLLGHDPDTDKASYTLLRQSQHPEDRLTFDVIDRNVRAGTLFDREYRVLLPGGGTRRLAHKGEVIFGADDKPRFDVAVVWDVNDRNHQLDEILADERRTRVLLEALDLFIGLLWMEGEALVPSKVHTKQPIHRLF